MHINLCVKKCFLSTIDMDIKIYHNNEKAPYPEISSLIRESFKERLDAGLNFGCATFSAKQLCDHVKNDYVFVAYDEDKIVGTVTISIKEKLGYKYGSHEFLAISNKMKGKGMATYIFQTVLEFAKEQELDFLTSTTAVDALSSIKYHKKNGFHIYRYDSFQSTNYYSYHFIRPIRKMLIFNYVLFRLPIFYITLVVCKLTKRKDGSKRF